jgi:hypothetical protein
MIRASVVRKSDRQNLSVGLDDSGRRIIVRGGETCCHYAARAKRGIELTGCLGEKVTREDNQATEDESHADILQASGLRTVQEIHFDALLHS